MNPFRRRAGAVAATLVIVAGGAVGGVALTAVTAGVANAALPSNVTFNDNGCTVNLAAGSPSLIALGIGADQTYAGLANTVDGTTGATVTGAGNVTVSAAGSNGLGLSPTVSVVQGGSSTLSNFGGHGFISAAFIGAGIAAGFISPGDTISANLTMTIDATNATFTGSGTSQITVHGTGGGVVPATGPLDAAIQFPDTPYTVPATGGINAYFYQDSTSIGAALPGNGNGANTDASGYLTAAIGALSVGIGCMPGEVSAATPPVYTQAAQGAVNVFAAVKVQPAQPPVLVTPLTGSANLGGPVILHPLTGATDNVAINPASGTLVTPPSHGSVSFNPANGDITYTETDLSSPAPASDTFSYTFSSVGGTSNVATANITIVAHPSNCDVSTQPTCTLDQTILVPVTGADLTMSQASGLPVDDLNHTLNGTSCTGNAITLNGQPQFACGAMFPITVVNATGADPGWTLSGQVSDFLDPSAPSTTTCDTPATYNNHCIPGGNLSWEPAAAVAHGIVAGDTAQVTPGTPLLGGLATLAPTVANAPPAIGAFGGATQTNPVIEPAPAPGLHDTAQTLCITAAGASGGTFICGAGLIVAVPASAAAPTAPGYEATLTLTLA
jgi:hypothetical protein